MHENENIARIQDLRSVAKTFFEKSLACTKISDVRAFFDLAQQANADADALESDLKIESCWSYMHFIHFFGYSDKYNSYLEFCARNRLQPVARKDYRQALAYKAKAASIESASAIAVQ